MTAYHYPRSPRAAERIHAAARLLLRRRGPDALDIAERRAKEARENGNRAALHHWRRTARSIATLLTRAR